MANPGFRAMSACIDRIQAHVMSADQVSAVHYAANQELERLTGINQAASALGRKGGASTSEAKIKAARDNGKKGGRPRKPRE